MTSGRGGTGVTEARREEIHQFLIQRFTEYHKVDPKVRPRAELYELLLLLLHGALSVCRLCCPAMYRRAADLSKMRSLVGFPCALLFFL